MESSDNYMTICPVEAETEAVIAINQSVESDILGPGREENVEKTVTVASRKRGRPKKYETSFVPDMAATCGKAGEKRGRGRPRGSTNRQMTSGLGGYALAACLGDGNFNAVAITIQRGEDIVEKVMAFIQKGVQALCILTASGPVSVVELRPGRFGTRAIRYEGYFEILTLVGSQMFVDGEGECRGPPMLSTTLACTDGRVFGGAIGGSLIAAASVQLVIGIIKQGDISTKKSNPMKRSIEPSNPEVNPPIASLLIDKASEKSAMMSPPHGDDNIAGDHSEYHHASSGKSDDQNGSQPSDHLSGETMSDEDNIDAHNASQPLDHVPGETLSDDDDGDAHEG